MILSIANLVMENGKATIDILEDIKQEEVEEFHKHLIVVPQYKHVKTLYKMTIANGNQLEAFLKDIYANNLSNKELNSDDIYTESNRLITNYCSFIGMYIDQTEKVISKIDKSQVKTLQEKCQQLYDAKFEYRFFVILRNFIIHYDFPFDLYIQDAVKGNGLYMTKRHLLSFSSWKHVKKDLQIMDDNIDIRQYIKPMNVCLTIMFYDFIYLISNRIVNAYEKASKFVIKHKVKAPAIVRYESIDSLKEGNIVCTPISFVDLQSALNDVKKHPKIELNINDITPEWMKSKRTNSENKSITTGEGV